MGEWRNGRRNRLEIGLIRDDSITLPHSLVRDTFPTETWSSGPRHSLRKREGQPPPRVRIPPSPPSHADLWSAANSRQPTTNSRQLLAALAGHGHCSFFWRRGRAVEGDRLESGRGSPLRGFESLRLLHFVDVPKWLKGSGCKPGVRRFESGRRLHLVFLWACGEMADTRGLGPRLLSEVRVRIPPGPPSLQGAYASQAM